MWVFNRHNTCSVPSRLRFCVFDAFISPLTQWNMVCASSVTQKTQFPHENGEKRLDNNNNWTKLQTNFKLTFLFQKRVNTYNWPSTTLSQVCNILFYDLPTNLPRKCTKFQFLKSVPVFGQSRFRTKIHKMITIAYSDSIKWHICIYTRAVSILTCFHAGEY